MKKFLVILISVLICFPTLAFAKEDYISLLDYPYSTHVLGEDLVIYGETNIANVSLGLYYPNDDQGYMGYAKLIIALTADELKKGYVIKTDTFSRLWPEGEWTVRVQSGDVYDTITIPMRKEADFNRKVKIAAYNLGAMESISTYKSRGGYIKDNVVTFLLENNVTMKIFSWNNFTPVSEGESRVFVAFYKDGYLTKAQSFFGTLSRYSDHISIENGENKLKIFCWDENLTPTIKAIG